jgi:hypothetical protein
MTGEASRQAQNLMNSFALSYLLSPHDISYHDIVSQKCTCGKIIVFDSRVTILSFAESTSWGKTDPLNTKRIAKTKPQSGAFLFGLLGLGMVLK